MIQTRKWEVSLGDSISFLFMEKGAVAGLLVVGDVRSWTFRYRAENYRSFAPRGRRRRS